MNQTLSYYSKKELQIVVIADTRFPDVAALQHFQVSSCQDLGLPCVPSDDDNADGSDIEDGEIADVGLEYDDAHQEREDDIANTMDTDDMVVERTDQSSLVPSEPPASALQPSSVSSGPSSGHATTFSLASLPRLYPPNITPSPISNDHGPPVVSLNSPEHSPLEPANRVFSFSSDFQSTASSRQSTPLDSGDSDASASRAMNALRVGSHKSKSLRSLSSNTSTRSASPQVSGASRPPSIASRKRPNEHPASAMADQMSKTAESLMMHLDEKRELRAEQERHKRMKLEDRHLARDLKVRNAREEREHALRLAEQDHTHKLEMMDHQLENTRLEIELARARREEEEARIRRIAMEKGL